MRKEVANRDHPLSFDIELFEENTYSCVKLKAATLDEYCCQQTGHEDFSQARDIVDRIELCFDPLGFDDSQAEGILKDNLAFFGNKIHCRRKVAGIDAFL